MQFKSLNKMTPWMQFTFFYGGVSLFTVIAQSGVSYYIRIYYYFTICEVVVDSDVGADS